MSAGSLFDGLIEPKTLQIFLTILSNPDQLYHLNSLAQTSKVPITSTARILGRLVKHNIITEQKIGKISVYSLAKNKKTETLRELING